MKVMTWNIWGGKYLDRVINLIHQENPDILALQEVTVQNGVNTANTIAKRLGYHVQYCKTFSTDRHTPSYDLGNAMLSKVPFSETSCVFLSSQDQYQDSASTEPRNAVVAHLTVNAKPYTVVATHLGYSEKFSESMFRQFQLQNLLKLLPQNNCILMGDFNALPESKVVRTLSDVLVNTDTTLTEPSMTDYHDEERTKYRIDYIFVSNDIPFTDFRIIETDASDHQPLVVTIS
jgi:endonuclease/exonuclease/phosphatase family metal-dependent hydrolase